MAVTITTQFYLPTTSGWSNLAKVVYTSANIPSPSVAGTRSHILPGELPLALWYEDLTNMYRRDNVQMLTVTGVGGYPPYSVVNTGNGSFHAQNSVVFELTSGECYNCRLTAWDDITHTTTNNFLISTGRVRASMATYRSLGTKAVPSGVVDVFPPAYNTVLSGNSLYYGDFNMIYEYPTKSQNGDYLIFKPFLYNINADVPYGVHDYVITLHYSYT